MIESVKIEGDCGKLRLLTKNLSPADLGDILSTNESNHNNKSYKTTINVKLKSDIILKPKDIKTLKVKGKNRNSMGHSMKNIDFYKNIDI